MLPDDEDVDDAATPDAAADPEPPEAAGDHGTAPGVPSGGAAAPGMPQTAAGGSAGADGSGKPGGRRSSAGGDAGRPWSWVDGEDGSSQAANGEAVAQDDQAWPLDLSALLTTGINKPTMRQVDCCHSQTFRLCISSPQLREDDTKAWTIVNL